MAKLSNIIKRVLAIREKYVWAKTTYSQCGEDVIIKFIFDQFNISKPSYIDIGAHHPFYLSNTALFYTSGSRGINIEPDPALFRQFKKHRKRDINLNIGIGDEQSTAEFYLISSPYLNTFSKKEAENYKNEGDFKITGTINIEVNTINNVLDKYANGRFPDFLNVDAEGIDDIIIRSIDLLNNCPLVICIETVSFSTSGKGIKNTALINYIIERGYFLYADTYINTIFVKKSAWQNSDPLQ